MSTTEQIDIPGTDPAMLRPGGGGPAGVRGSRRRAGAAVRRPAAAAVLGTGLILIGLNLRIGVAAVGPVLADIRASLGLSASVASLLTTIPVVAFGVFAFGTPGLSRRIGMHRLLGLTMLALAAGIVLRLHSSLAALFAGTILIGAAIAIGNVLMPAAIKQDFAHRTGLMMGLYSTALFVGAALASGLTAPILPAVGGQWRAALAVWAIPAVLALLVWIPQLRRTPERARTTPTLADGPDAPGEPPMRALLTDPTAIAVTALMGLQSMGYYAMLTWVPSILQDDGMDATSAGWMLSYSAFPGIAAALFTPALARRMRPAWLPVLASVVLTALAYTGLACAPATGTYVWMTLLGLGQGAAISLSLTYIVWRSPDTHHTGHVSTMAQGFGYLFAGAGPLAMGAVHTATGGWAVPLLVLGLLLALQLAAGAIASRDVHVRARSR
ncbi:CynX/NimT family MFS transporter [Tomitella gaofuii]|uniref:CynX/NimT family MFS transporter n=1 Tax=Tomitella gaofuii TaxID=2760083 RepID=UPI001C711288|nr:MFS transporter [Tomitella gaofuii]